MTTFVASPPTTIIRWHYLWYVAAALAVMVVAIASDNHWFLNFVHVLSGLLWTGIDLFMGFVLGPILRKVPIAVRREILIRLVPRTLFLMPTLSTLTGTTGWFLAQQLGFTELPWPEYGWVSAALALVALMTIQGVGYLLPTNLRVCFELQKPDPDHAKIQQMMKRFFFVVALQGTMQVATIVIMARFVTGI
ncbi:MAG TPA: hypothetical protein VHA77_15260 [Xanthobacteraceae bacterium]|jgi:hypothetical protein|nr:hypothetical protein [Xanthobacteraceae bacterium]